VTDVVAFRVRRNTTGDRQTRSHGGLWKMDNPNWPQPAAGNPPGVVLPRVDVLETDTEFVYIFEVPGTDPEQIDVEVSAREIALTGPQNRPPVAGTRRWHHLERPQGRYMRILRTPPDVNADDATARYRHGELELHLPKRKGAH